MEAFHDRIATYLEGLVPERPVEMQAMEAYARKHRFPIIGPTAGYACYQIARMIQARQVFELGSGYGYSTAWFARAVKDNGGGIVHHVVWDEKLSSMARIHMQAMDLEDVVSYTVSEAIEALRHEEGPFDLIFNDINKEAYPESLMVIEEKLRPGGVLIVDNGFRGGRIFDEEDWSPATNGVREITRLLTRSEGWVTTLLPIRDGLLVAYKL